MPGSGCAFPLYYRTETSFPYDNKRSARMRTRRKGRWLPKQPRLGARMCPGTFFFFGYNAGGENGCPSVPLLPPVLHCPFRRKKVKGGLRPFFICCTR